MSNRSRRTLAGVVLLLMASVASAEAQTPCTDNWPNEGLNLAGSLNGANIRAFLDLGYPADPDDGVFGVVFYPERWSPGNRAATEIALDGTLTRECEFRLTDSAGGIWRLRFVRGRPLEGTREYPAGVSTAVALRVAPVTDCSGRGAWRRFTSPGWPITFEYPTSWRLAEDGNGIVIDCPSAASLARGGTPIWLQSARGTERVVTEDGRRGSRIDVFVTFGKDEWLIGQGCEDFTPGEFGVSCSPARRSTRRGMTVLQGSAGEHRRYRPGGGYIGQGGGVMSYLFMLGDEWVRIHSEDTPASIDDMQARGPVIFGGDGVTERIVRSIRRR